MKQPKNKEIDDSKFKEVVIRLDKRFNSWYRTLWHGMLHGAGLVLGAALLVFILALVLDFLGFTELSEAIRLYGRYGQI